MRWLRYRPPADECRKFTAQCRARELPQPDKPRNGQPKETTFEETTQGGFVQRDPGYVIMGMDGPETAPPPMPPNEDLRQAAERQHSYPDLAQPPVKEQFADAAAFNKALIQWMVNVGPAVVRRDRQKAKGRPSAKDIIAAARARPKTQGGNAL